MKRRQSLIAVLLTGLLACGSLFFPAVAAASETTSAPVRTLSVTGQGRLDVMPDTATVTLGVSQLAKTPGEAYAAMSHDLISIADAVKATGVKEDQIKTGLFNLYAEYNWTQAEGQILKGYRATTSLKITTQDLTKVASLVQTAVTAGANQLEGISFYVKDSEALLEQVLDMAVDDAKAKADRVARRLGAKVVRVNSVSIQDQGVPMVVQPEMTTGSKAAADGAAPAPVFGGTSSFSASVSVTFEIE